MSPPRPRRSPDMPARFRAENVDAPQHATSARQATVIGAAASRSLPPPRPARKSSKPMPATRLTTAAPPLDAGQTLVQNVFQQFVIPSSPMAVARPVLPSEDLWSLEGLQAHVAAPSSSSRWCHGRRRTPILPATTPPPPTVPVAPTAVAPPSCATEGAPAPPAPPFNPRVASALAFVASVRSEATTAPVGGSYERSTSSVCPPTNPAVRYALEFARAQSAKQAAEDYAASQRAYSDGLGRVCILRRAGRLLDASELLATLVPPPPPPPSSSRTLSPPHVSLVQRSVSAGGTSRVHTRVPLLALDDWRSLVAAASALPQEDAAATTSPVHVITRGLLDLEPGARRARAQALVAAAKIVPFMTIDMIAKFLGYPSDELRKRDPSLVAADAVRAIGSGWSAGLIDGARTTWMRLQRFASAAGGRPVDARRQLYGHVVRDFLEAVDLAARRAYSRHGAVRAGDAQGSTARQGVARNLKFLATNLSFPIDISSKAVQISMTHSRRRSVAKSAPPLGVRMLCVLSWLTQHGPSPFVRGHAAAWLAAAMFALRFANAQRSRLVAVVGDVVSAHCDLDAKASGGSQVGRPMWTSRRDPLGSDAWISELVAMRDARPRCALDDPRYFLRDTNSPDGDPSKATAWIDAPCPQGRRAVRSLRALGALSPWPLPESVLATLTGHSPRHDLPNVSRACGDPLADTNEIGRWSGSQAQLAPGSAADPVPAHYLTSLSAPPAPGRSFAMPALYSSAAAAAIVPEIMERQLRRLRAVVAHRDPATLPFVGGWSLVRSLGDSPQLPSSSIAASTQVVPSDPLLLTHRTDGEDVVVVLTQCGSGAMDAPHDVPHPILEDTRAQVP